MLQAKLCKSTSAWAADTGHGKMAKPKGGLTKWFKEDWVDISTKNKSGKHPKCGRKTGSGRGYPKCVPAAKAARMTASQKKRAVARKRATNPSRGRSPTYART